MMPQDVQTTMRTIDANEITLTLGRAQLVLTEASTHLPLTVEDEIKYRSIIATMERLRSDLKAIWGHEGEIPLVSRKDADTETKRLKLIIDVERSQAADWLQRIRAQMHGWTWIAEGRGPYEWDDDRYRREFANAMNSITDACNQAALDCNIASFQDCPPTNEEVVHVRALPCNALPDHTTADGSVKEAMAELIAGLQHVFNRAALGDHHFVQAQPPLEDALQTLLEQGRALETRLAE